MTGALYRSKRIGFTSVSRPSLANFKDWEIFDELWLRN